MAYSKKIVTLCLSLYFSSFTSAWDHTHHHHSSSQAAESSASVHHSSASEKTTISAPTPSLHSASSAKSSSLAQPSGSKSSSNSTASSGGYTNKIATYDATNWFTSFDYQDERDPTGGTVDYLSLADAQSTGLTRVFEDKVFMGVDNTTAISASSSAGRKSIWVTSKEDYTYGLLIGDFAHMPSSTCGLWPAFWTINKDQSNAYGEIDIVESYSTKTQNYVTLHTQNNCSFVPPSSPQIHTGTVDDDQTKCQLDAGSGCSIAAHEGTYGDPFNAQGGGVYAMEWTADYIRVYYFPRDSIPDDITSETPDPSTWGLPNASFESQYGGCDIADSFPAQTIYFDTTFCGSEAGGQAWEGYDGEKACQASTGVSTCEEFVRTHPEVYDDAYWLVNYVKVFQK